MTIDTDRIQKNIVLRASRERIWRAISDAKQFGTWFGVEFEGDFVVGSHLKGRIVPTKVDADIAKTQEAYSGMAFEIFVERIEPMRVLAFRWHPYAVEPGRAFSTEPTTLVTFVLENAPGGISLTITESGFDQIPLERRAEAFMENEKGWAAQTQLIQKYLAQFPEEPA